MYQIIDSNKRLIEENGKLQAEKRDTAERIRLLEIEVGKLNTRVRELEHLLRVSG